MDTFKPTDEQLFDYHLKAVDPKIGRQIQTYLVSHPEAETQLQNYKKIEAAFKSCSLEEPSQDVLERVREGARRQVSSQKNIFGFLKSGLYFRQLSWALMIVLVVGLGYGLHELRDGTFVGTQELAKGRDTKLMDASKTATVHTGVVTSENALNRVDDAVSGLQAGDGNQKLLKDYETALELFRNSHFKEASALFSHIMTNKPAFEKRAELYSYWVKALEELGALELANEKRDEMKKF